jgi:hypothetical protein
MGKHIKQSTKFIKSAAHKGSKILGEVASKTTPTLKNVYKQPISMKKIVDQGIKVGGQLIKKTPKGVFQAGKVVGTVVGLTPWGKGAKIAVGGGKIAWKTGKSLFKAFQTGYKKGKK